MGLTVSMWQAQGKQPDGLWQPRRFSMRVHSVNIRTTAPAAPWRQHRRDKKEDAVLMRVLYRQLNHDGDLPLNPEKRWLRKSRALHAMVSLQLGLNDLRLPLAVIAGE